MGRMMLSMLAGFAQFERDLCAERTKSALKHKKSKREVYLPVPLGFVQVGKHLVANLSEQAIISTIKALRAAGKSLRAIAAELTQLGRTMTCMEQRLYRTATTRRVQLCACGKGKYAHTTLLAVRIDNFTSCAHTPI